MKKNLLNIIMTCLFFVFPYFFVKPVSAQYGPEQKITVVQNFPAAVRPGSDFMVEIKIGKGNVSGLAKFQQYIPAGMTATAMESAGADFSFEQQNVKLIWTSVPPNENITLRYKISVSPTLTGKKILSGTFSYVENDRTKRASLVPKEIDITPTAPAAEIAKESKRQETQPEKTEPAASTQQEESKPEAKTETSPVNTASAETTPQVIEEKKQVEESKPASPPPTATTTATPVSAPAPTEMEKKTETVNVPENVTPPVSTGVVFKVQIAAMNEKHFRRKNYFQEKFGLQMEVNTEEHDGLKKYTVGSFNSYAQARKLRDEIHASVDGSFVVAYKDGVRIPVSEAIEFMRKK
jgi:hypothetical protein